MNGKDILCGKWKGFPIVYKESDRKYYYLRDNKEINIFKNKKDRGRDCSSIYEEREDFLITEHGSFNLSVNEFTNELYDIELCGVTGMDFEVENIYYSKNTGKFYYLEGAHNYVEIDDNFTVDPSILTTESVIDFNEIINEVYIGNYSEFCDTIFNTTKGIYSEAENRFIATPLKFICGMYDDGYDFAYIYATEDSKIYIPKLKEQLTVPEGVILKEWEELGYSGYTDFLPLINTDQGIFLLDFEDDNWYKFELDYTDNIVKGVRYGDREDLELYRSDIIEKSGKEILDLLPSEFVLCGRFQSTPIIYGTLSGRYYWVTKEDIHILFSNLKNEGSDCSDMYDIEDNFLITEYCKMEVNENKYGIDLKPIIPEDYIDCCRFISYTGILIYYSRKRKAFINVQEGYHNFFENKSINLKDMSILKPEEYEGQLDNIAQSAYNNNLNGIIVNTTKGVYLCLYDRFVNKKGEIYEW